MLLHSSSIEPDNTALAKTNGTTIMYTGSLVPADFSGAVLTCAYFEKIGQKSSLWDFHSISEGIFSVMRLWLIMT